MIHAPFVISNPRLHSTSHNPEKPTFLFPLSCLFWSLHLVRVQHQLWPHFRIKLFRSQESKRHRRLFQRRPFLVRLLGTFSYIYFYFISIFFKSSVSFVTQMSISNEHFEPNGLHLLSYPRWLFNIVASISDSFNSWLIRFSLASMPTTQFFVNDRHPKYRHSNS